jgi:hypothetical protein
MNLVSMIKNRRISDAHTGKRQVLLVAEAERTTLASCAKVMGRLGGAGDCRPGRGDHGRQASFEGGRLAKRNRRLLARLLILRTWGVERAHGALPFGGCRRERL